MSCEPSILPASLSWQSLPNVNSCLENALHIRLVESSIQTVRRTELHVQAHESNLAICPELHAQAHETYLAIHPIFLVETYTFAVSHLKAVDQLLRTFHSIGIFETKLHPHICYCHWSFLLHKVKHLFQSTFSKSLHCCFYSFYQLVLCAFVRRLRLLILLTYHRIALAFENQCSRILSKIAVLVTKNYGCIFLSTFSFLCIVTSAVLLLFCKDQTLLSSELRGSERLSIPIGGGRQYLFSNSSVVPFIKQGGEQLTSDHVFRYVDHVDDIGCLAYPLESGYLYANLTRSYRSISF